VSVPAALSATGPRSHPFKTCEHHRACQVRRHRPAVLRIRRDRNGPFPQARQIVLSHQALDGLMIDQKALSSNAPIAVEPVLERDALNRITYARLFLARRRRSSLLGAVWPPHIGRNSTAVATPAANAKSDSSSAHDHMTRGLRRGIHYCGACQSPRQRCEGAQHCAVPYIPGLLMKADDMFKILCSALCVT
jgi:hypothetical protein